MTELLHDLADWLIGFVGSDWAILVLTLSSFAEAIFFPVPPDPLLVAMAILQPHLAIGLGILVTVASVAGAVVGHWAGQCLGRPFLNQLFAHAKVDRVERAFKRFGVWTVLVASFTPLPYKVFAISAGALNFDRRTFIVASLVGRGARFITLGALVSVFGKEIETFIADKFGFLTIALSLTLVVGVAVWVVLHRLHRETGAAE